MRHSRSFVAFVEAAIDQSPFCACGARMTPVDHDGSIWLECTTHDEVPRGLGARISALFFGHDRQLLVVGEEQLA